MELLKRLFTVNGPLQDILKDYNSGSRPSGSVTDQGVTVSINVVPLHVQVKAKHIRKLRVGGPCPLPCIKRVAQVNADTSTLNTHVWFVMQVRASLCDINLHFLQNQHLRAKDCKTYLILLCHLSGRIADFDGQPQTMKMLAR